MSPNPYESGNEVVRAELVPKQYPPRQHESLEQRVFKLESRVNWLVAMMVVAAVVAIIVCGLAYQPR